jgi:hypothetical protein
MKPEVYFTTKLIITSFLNFEDKFYLRLPLVTDGQTNTYLPPQKKLKVLSFIYHPPN